MKRFRLYSSLALNFILIYGLSSSYGVTPDSIQTDVDMLLEMTSSQSGKQGMYLEAEAFGYGRTKRDAKRAAEICASAGLLEQIKGICLTSERIHIDGINVMDVITARAEGILRNRQVIEAFTDIHQYADSDSPETTFEARVKVRAWVPEIPRLVVERIQPVNAYTGLIIVAKGLSARPVLAPKIYTFVNGGLFQLYGQNDMVDKVWPNRLLVEYAQSEVEARCLMASQIGKNPLVIQARASTGREYRADVIISCRDAVKIFEANRQSTFLEAGKVVFVID